MDSIVYIGIWTTMLAGAILGVAWMVRKLSDEESKLYIRVGRLEGQIRDFMLDKAFAPDVDITLATVTKKKKNKYHQKRNLK
jgi:hypothetical protein